MFITTLQSKSKNPRSLPPVPSSAIKDEQPHYHHFYYACAGYSIYLDQKSGKESSGGDKDTPQKLPVCVGLELLIGKKAAATAPTAAAAPALNKEDANEARQPAHPQRPKPIQPAGSDFYAIQILCSLLLLIPLYRNRRCDWS